MTTTLCYIYCTGTDFVVYLFSYQQLFKAGQIQFLYTYICSFDQAFFTFFFTLY